MVEYLRVAERQLSVKTLAYRKTVYRRFLQFVGNIPATQITTPFVEKYLLKRPTNHNFNKDRTELMKLFNWGLPRECLPVSPLGD